MNASNTSNFPNTLHCLASEIINTLVTGRLIDARKCRLEVFINDVYLSLLDVDWIQYTIALGVRDGFPISQNLIDYINDLYSEYQMDDVIVEEDVLYYYDDYVHSIRSRVIEANIYTCPNNDVYNFEYIDRAIGMSGVISLFDKFAKKYGINMMKL